MKDWIFTIALVIFFIVVLVQGALDFLSRMPHTPLGAFFVIVCAIPVWIVAKTLFMRPTDEEITRDWDFYAAFIVISILVFLIGLVVLGIMFVFS